VNGHEAHKEPQRLLSIFEYKTMLHGFLGPNKIGKWQK